MTEPTLDEKMQDFRKCLKDSKRVLALLGAGFSAASGLPTFRGAGGFWRTYKATSLATPEAFKNDPGLVWEFYSYRRHMSIMAKPNPGHYALAELAKLHPDFITLSQNVDGLSPRAGHPQEKIHFLHGDLFTVKCSNSSCTYTEQNNFVDPIAPALSAALESGPNPKSALQPKTDPLDSDSSDDEDWTNASEPTIPKSELPHCPKCNELLRPGVVWFGEELPTDVIKSIDDWIKAGPKIDLIMVIGTSSTVWPAAGYVELARNKGARVAVINLEPDERQRNQVGTGDWLFEGDAGLLVPEMVGSVVGGSKEIPS